MTITRSPYICNPDILFCHEARSTRPVALDFGGADMLPAGTLISCEGKAVNDLTALGVLLYDTWKGYGSGQGVVLISGHVDLAKAQEHSGLTYSSEAKAALKGVCFVGDTEVPSGGGASDCDWNIMKNKPFGEETKSITYDGTLNPVVDNEYVKVSDEIPDVARYDEVEVQTSAEGSLGFFELDWGNDGTGWDPNVPEILIAADEVRYVIIALEDNVACNLGGFDNITFPTKGVYFRQFASDYVTKLSWQCTKTLDPKYLPEALQFGEETGTKTLADHTGALVDTGSNPYSYAKYGYFPATEYIPLTDGMQVHFAFTNNRTGYSFDEDIVMYGSSLEFKAVGEDGYTGSNLRISNDDTNQRYKLEEVAMGEGLMETDEVIVKMTIEDKVVKPLDEKYMPLLTSPNGTQYKLSVSDDGTLTATEV